MIGKSSELLIFETNEKTSFLRTTLCPEKSNPQNIVQ